MRRAFTLFGALLLFVNCVGGVLVTTPTYHASAASLLQPTPDANEVLNRANAALQAAQGSINTFNILIPLGGVLIGLLALFAPIVPFTATRAYRMVQSLEHI